MSTVVWDVAVTVLSPNHKPAHVDIDLYWSDRNPFTVSILFGEDLPDWIVSRDLLATGLDRAVGLGDVSVLPDLSVDSDDTCVELVLSTPSGRAALLIDRVDLDSFLTRTFRDVPAGQERVVPEDPIAAIRELDGSGA